MKKIIAILLTLTLVVTGLSFSAFAEAAELKFEGESTPFTVTDDTGKTTSTNKESKWAWSLNLSINESKPSGALTYFRSGGVGGTVDFEIELDAAASYDLYWAFRPNDASYSTVQVLVNGTPVGDPVSMKTGDTVAGAVNGQNIIREINVGNAVFVAGKNTVSFKIVERGTADDSKSALTVDYFRLAAPAAVEPEQPTMTLPYRVEAESTPFTVTDCTGMTTSENKASAWAWSLNLGGYEDTKSGALTYFRSGGIGGTVDFEVDIPEAGNYGITWRMRTHTDSYATVQVLVNGEEIGGLISQKAGMTVGGKVNGENGLRSVVLGNADFAKGENIVTFKLVGARDDGDMSKTGFVVDYIELTEPVDESSLTFTEFPQPEPEPEPEFTLPVRIEAESTPFTVTDAKGTTTSENKASDWAWSLNLNITESKPSGTLTYFRSGGIDGTVDFKVNVAKAGNYGVVWQYRPNHGSYSSVQVLVNGKEVGGIVSQQTGLTVGGVVNKENILRTVVLGNADFAEGENVITFKMVGAREDGDMNQSGFTIDYIDLTESVDESGLTFTELPQPEPDTEPEPVDPPKTGDSLTAVAAAAAAAALLGGVLLTSKRKRTQI